MGFVRNVGRVFSPLDEELELTSERLTPHAHACLVRYGAIIPSFEKARKEVAFALKIEVSEATTRRYTQTAGKAYVDGQTAEVERLERETPPAPDGPEKLFFSADGAMIPLVGGEWAEVKTMTIGEITAPVLEKGEWAVHSQQHSYFSRMVEAASFQRLALVESHRRGVENAPTVAAVTDGAEWEQGLIDFHCPKAVRVLDFSHAGEHLGNIGQALWETEDEVRQTWLEEQLHTLKHEGPTPVLADLLALQSQYPQNKAVLDNFNYLNKREGHMHYPDYQAQGLPIGSGAMESGNKVVVEARLKGAGMHWAPQHVDPMLALRNALCSDRWDEAWFQILTELRRAERQRKKEHLERKQFEGQVAASQIAEETIHVKVEPVPPAQPNLERAEPEESTPPSGKPHIPAPNHPWRRSPIGKAKFLPSSSFSKN